MDGYTDNEELNELLLAWGEARKKIHKKPLDEASLSLNLRKLDKISGGDINKKIELVSLAVEKSWLAFHEPDREHPNKSPTHKNPSNNVTQLEDIKDFIQQEDGDIW